MCRRGGAAMHVHSKLQNLIIDRGSLAGNMVHWMRRIGIEGGDVNILNLYASNMASEQYAMW